MDRRITVSPQQMNDTQVAPDTGLNHLAPNSLSRQKRRQLLSRDWQPRGFERYRYQQALLHGMNVLGGIDDGYMPGEERYEPIAPCNDKLDCTCEGVYE